MEIQYPAGLAETIRDEFGVKVKRRAKVDKRRAMSDLAVRLRGEDPDTNPYMTRSDFGNDVHFGFLGNLSGIIPGGKKVKAKVTADLKAQAPQHSVLIDKLGKAKEKPDVERTVKVVASVVKTAAPLAAFLIPGIGPIVGGAAMAAMAAGDKVLSDPNVKQAADVIKNTRALASMGDEAAKRGVAVLDAVAQVRKKVALPAGQALVKIQTPQQAQAVQTAIEKSYVTVPPSRVEQLAISMRVGIIDKFLDWLGL